jgi:LCP family protein required for cell wall assembly
LGNGDLPDQRISDYASSGYAEPSDYRGAEAFSADRYRDRSDEGYNETAQQRDYSPTPNASEGYSVSDSRARYAAAGKRRRRKRRITAAVVAVVAVVAIAVGAVTGFFGTINSALHSGLDSSLWSVLSRVNAGEPFYMLLLGTDESADRQDDEELGGVFRSDTIILTRVDPKEQTLTMISIPRDTQVELGEYGTQKINAAHAFGGATLAVQAVEELTGLPISHYAEINFDGFIGLVDALGGVEVDVPMAIDDEALYQATVDMRRTKSDDPLGYCQKWIAFEERFQEVVPAIPIYSNVYFDFYPRVLHQYNIASNIAWSQAVVGAYLSDVSDDELQVQEDEQPEGDGVDGEQPENGIEIVGPDGETIEIIDNAAA